MRSHTLWGMIHVPRLPGSGSNFQPISEVVDFCLTDAKTYFDAGVDHLFIENFGDAPFSKTRAEPHVIAGLTTVIEHIKQINPKVTFGVNVLRNDALSALAIATITNSFVIRVNVLTHARLTDQGIIEGCSFELSRYKNQLNSSVKVWADIEVKHSYPLANIPTASAVHDTLERAGADKLIFSGSHTGVEADLNKIKSLVESSVINPEKVVIGSGITEKNIEQFLPFANNFIVGSSLKMNNNIKNHVDPDKVSRLVAKI